jgi:hypothetical protein
LPVPTALVQADDGYTRQRGQLLESLGHMVGVLRATVILAKHQVVVQPSPAVGRYVVKSVLSYSSRPVSAQLGYVLSLC